MRGSDIGARWGGDEFAILAPETSRMAAERLAERPSDTAEGKRIWALFVDPAHEGRGYGRQLHDAMVAWLWEQGVTRAWLTTTAGTRAHRFYVAAGWTLAGPASGGEIRFELSRPPNVRA